MNRKAQEAYLRFLLNGRRANPLPIKDTAFDRLHLYSGNLRWRADAAIVEAVNRWKEQWGRLPTWGDLAGINDKYWRSIHRVGNATLREIQEFFSSIMAKS